MKKILFVIITIIIFSFILLGRLSISFEGTRRVDADSIPETSTNWVLNHVNKFRDGNVTCYLYTINYGGGISCIKD